MQRVHVAVPLLLASLCLPALTQSPLIVPNAAAAAEGNANNAYPWNRNNQSQRVQFCYDSTQFAAMTGPQVITRLRWRADAATATTTWTGGSWPNVQIDMSTSALDHLALSTTFDNNHGPNRLNVHMGAVNVLPGAGNGTGVPGPFYIDITLTTPFVYDPANGDLLIDIMLDGTGWTGVGRPCDHHSGTATAPIGVTRVYSSLASPTAPTGTIGTNYGAVMEVTFVPAVGLFPAFTATPRSGPSPLLVQFTDRTFTSHGSGVVAWSWDVDGDSVIDYTTQNPSHTYAACGTYNVSLTAVDGSGPATTTRTSFVTTDVVTPSFTWNNIGGNVIQFTDTSTPTPTSWAWDLDGDGLTDTTLQNPVRPYSNGCVGVRVSLTVNRLCQGPFTTSQSLVLAPNNIGYMTGSTSTSATLVGFFFDVTVTNPMGVSICALTLRPNSVIGNFNVAVYVTPGTYLNNDATAAVWRLAASGSGSGTPTPAIAPLQSPLYLPAGNFGMAVYVSQPGNLSTSVSFNSVPTTGHPGPISNADITLFPAPATAPGRIRTALFGGGLLNNYIVNCTLHYGTCNGTGDAGYGFFGPGCPGALGIPGNIASALPRLNSTMTMQLNRLPQSVAFLLLGFSNTSSPFGPLPFNMTGFGAPNCFGRVSPDSTLLLIGAANMATFNMGIPGNPSLLCTQFFTQGLALDPPANALGAVATDAAAGIVGQ